VKASKDGCFRSLKGFFSVMNIIASVPWATQSIFLLLTEQDQSCRLFLK